MDVTKNTDLKFTRLIPLVKLKDIELSLLELKSKRHLLPLKSTGRKTMDSGTTKRLSVLLSKLFRLLSLLTSSLTKSK